ASFGLLTAVAGSMYFAAKKWGRAKDKGGQKARIEMMHQFHLGPKKSVALIRVAGEALLIGVTDQNINMLKPVTLIDEELEQVMGKDFNNFLEDEFSVEDVRTAMRARA
ncbi:MAG TPA: flagellar biosynthetic protein FliO, partial [Bdellovibrionales bacterium]|nr:flagellar biosynthetic protein FliO [Bdellovibrionales bacterium]